MRSFITFAALALLLPPALYAEEAPKKAAEKKINFEDHIKPIFREHCTACHSEGDKESDLALDSYGATLAGGSSGEVIAEGNTSGSRLFALLTHAERPFMPPDEDPIAKDKIDLVKTWIEQGMPENSGSKIRRTNNAAAAMLSSVSLGKPDGPPPMPEQLLRQPVVETDRSAAISAMAASPWAPLIAVGGQYQVTLYHSQSGEMLGIIPFPEGEPQSLTFTRDGKQLLIGGGRHGHSGSAVLVDVATGKRIAKVGDELDIVLAADISPDKSRIAIGGPKKMIRIFDSLSGELIVEMKKHTDWIFAIRYSPDGILLASGDRSSGLVVWEAETGRLYTDLAGHKGDVRGIDFRADSNVLVSGSLDGTIKLWDMNESKEIKSWNAHAGGVTSVAFSNDGSIASAGRDARIKLWNGNGELQKEFKGLSESALEVALTGDSTCIAGGDWNGKVQLWQASDPSKTRLIAANPPSIEKRLAAANATMAAARARLDAAGKSADKALAQSKESQRLLTQVRETTGGLATLLAAAVSQQKQLPVQLTNLDTKIKELENQLAALRGQRKTVASQLNNANNQFAQLTAQSKSAGQVLKAADAKHAELNSASTAASKLRQELQVTLDAAAATAKQAADDKAALNARATALEQQATTTAAKAQSLTDLLQAAVDQEQAEQSQAKKSAVQLSSLQTQLAALQNQVEAAIEAQTQAKQQLQSKQKATVELKNELDAAQQAALDAKEQRELFRQSYSRPN